MKIGLEYEALKRKKDSSDSSESKGNTSSTTSLIVIIAVVLAIIGFIVYRKRNKPAEDRFISRRTRTSPSPPISEIEQNRSSIWAAINESTQQQGKLTIV